MTSGGAPVEIRLLTPEDSLADLTHLLHRSYARLAEMGLRFVATWQDEEITRKRVAKGECWVAVREGRIVGTILFQDAAATEGCPEYDRPGVSSFHQFAVDPEWQGEGIGVRLLEQVEKRARETGARELALDTAEPATHLIAFYSRRGYRLVGHTQWRATNYRSVILSKEVAPGG